MVFTHSKSIANIREWYWQARIEPFIVFPNMKVNGGILDFNKAIDYFDIDSDSAEKLRRIGLPFNIFDNPLHVAIPDFEILIFKDFNDQDGIGSLLWKFTNPERERQVYGIYASLFYIEKSIYCALTII